MPTKTYGAKRVIASFDGRVFSGYLDGDFLAAAQTTPDFQMKVGSDGEAVFEQMSDPTGTVRITLMQTADANDYLSAWHRASKLDPSKVGVLQVEDTNGRSLYHASQVKLEKFPDSSFAKEIGGREWTFLCLDLTQNVGGN